ncbi:unnamed protein product, partial [marine sediment metagenome]
ILRIPTGESYPSLNLSHACAIILYEIFKKINIINIGRGKHPVELAERPMFILFSNPSFLTRTQFSITNSFIQSNFNLY